MHIVKTDIPGVIITEPATYSDERGYFLETYNKRDFKEAGIDATFVQSNLSFSAGNVLRGLHIQRYHPQGKLMRVAQGKVFDVAVDVRRSSPTFCKWVGVTLDTDKHQELYIPEGFAHGFCVLSAVAVVEYHCTELYHPGDEIVIRWDDPEIGIDWPIKDPVLSEKDNAGKNLKEIHDQLPPF